MTRLFAVPLLLCIALTAYGDTWHDTNAQPLATGALLAVNRDSIRITKSDNSTSDIKLDALSVADRAEIADRGNSLSEFKRPIRTWTSSGGTFHVDAKVVWFDDSAARLLLTDDRVVNVPQDKLSKDDRDYLNRITKLLAKKETNPFVADTDVLNPFGDNAAHPAAAKSASSPRALQSPPTSSSTTSNPNRNPSNETVTGYTATGIPEFTGPRGGIYHYSKNGNKVYEKHK